MKNLQPCESEAKYTFPTELPAQRGGLTPYQKQQIETDFENHPAFQRRRLVTIVVVAVVVGTLVAHIMTHGINWTALFATLCGVGAALAVRNIYTPRHTGTKQYYEP